MKDDEDPEGSGARAPTEAAAPAQPPGDDLQERGIDLIADLYADAGRTFRGDMRAVALLAVLRQADRRAQRLAEVSGVPVRTLPVEQRGMTQSRLSALTGISRETVRRKVTEMERLGWLEREGMAWIIRTVRSGSPALHLLSELEERQIDRLRELVAAASARYSRPDLD